MSQRWVKQWQIEGNSGTIHTVSVSDDGTWGCSCPVWKFKRKECHHIMEVKVQESWNEADVSNIIKLKSMLINRYVEQGKNEKWIEKRLTSH